MDDLGRLIGTNSQKNNYTKPNQVQPKQPIVWIPDQTKPIHKKPSLSSNVFKK